MGYLTTVHTKTLTARQAAAMFVASLYDTTREIDPKWDGPRFRLVDGRVWYEVKITKEGFEIHDTEQREGGGI
jgi:hypothetical protein